MTISRRRFLGATGAAGAVAATGAWRNLLHASPVSNPLPSPANSGIDHIVMVLMENRSFDHYLGWVPGADGQQAGLTYYEDPAAQTGPHSTFHMTDWTGCGYGDPGHSVDEGNAQFRGGASDGFIAPGSGNDDFALGYYTQDDLALSKSLVDNFTICDNWFCSYLGPTYPNRLFTHSARTDRFKNSSDESFMPTIWDGLIANNVSCKYYFSDLPVLALYGRKAAQSYVRRSSHVAEFFADAAAGQLPSFSYLDPFFLGEGQGTSNDDHPHADVRRGQAFLSQVVNAVMSAPTWSKTVLVITYDEWGGFYDHVRPPAMASISPTIPNAGQAGFRVPAYVVSPFAPKQVASNVYDHTSMLKMVEWRFGLSPMSERDAAARNLAEVLDLGYTNPATSVTHVTDPGPHLCQDGLPNTPLTNSEPFWEDLANSSLMRAWRSLV